MAAIVIALVWVDDASFFLKQCFIFSWLLITKKKSAAFKSWAQQASSTLYCDRQHYKIEVYDFLNTNLGSLPMSRATNAQWANIAILVSLVKIFLVNHKNILIHLLYFLSKIFGYNQISSFLQNLICQYHLNEKS